MAPKKKVVLWCSKPPYPAHDGGTRAIQSTLKSLRSLDLELWVVCLSTYKHPFVPEKWPRDMQPDRLLVLPVNTKIYWWMIFKLFSSKYPLQLWRFGRTKRHQQKKAQAFFDTISPDLVVWDGLPAAWWRGQIKVAPFVKEVYRSHNLEYKVYKALWERTKNRLKKHLLLKENRRLRQFEEQLWKSVDEVWSISEVDRNEIALNKGVKCTYWPNRLGIEWLLKEVWPLVVGAIPEATLHLAGKAFPKDVDWDQQPGIYCHGELEDIAPFVAQMDVLVVPIWEGSGIRIKILEALDYGKLVLSTSVGLEGLAKDLRNSIPESKNANDMAATMQKVFQNREERMALASAQQKAYWDNYSPEKLIGRLKEIMEAL
jgi:polysaccharide biosynthesis protein PslH